MMNSNLLSILLTLAAMTSASAEVLEQWTFSETDGTPINQTYSNKGSQLVNLEKASASVQGGKLKFTGEGDEDSIFLISEFAGAALRNGVYEVSWIFPNAAFAGTHEVNGKASLGLDIRDTSNTKYKGMDDVVLGGVRLSYMRKQIEIHYQDHQIEQYEVIAKIERVVLPEPLHVRIRLDLTDAGQKGSMQVFLRLGDDEEINPIQDGILPVGSSISGYRIMQQITNGGTNWQKGDYVSVDNFTLSKIRD